MRFLVNGASGFVGRALVRELASEGATGWAVSRSPIAKLPVGWRWVSRRDALQPASVPDAPDALIHLEVKQHVLRPTPADVREFSAVNVEGFQTWLNWCASRGVRRVVYLSSIKAVRPASAGATFEDASGPNPSPYGESKWQAEHRVKSWVDEDLSRTALILRPAVVYGPECVGNVGAMVQAIRSGRFFLVGQNQNVKTLVSIRNAVAAICYLMRKMGGHRCDIYNIADRESFTVRQLDEMIRTALGKAGSSPQMPMAVARAAAVIGGAWSGATGRDFAITPTKLAALLENTHFPAEKLIRAGFVHPESTAQGMADMVATRFGG